MIVKVKVIGEGKRHYCGEGEEECHFVGMFPGFFLAAF
jgi:hypothetical protein